MQLGNVFDYNKLPEPLSKEETISYFKNKDEKARELLITHNIRLVLNYVLKLNTNCDKNELIEIALFGLIKAVDNYDYKKGINFSTFAISCIRNEILMFIKYDSKFSKEESYEKEIVQKVNDEIEDIYYKDTLSLATYSYDVEEFILKQEENEVIRKIIDNLPSRDKEFISLYCGFYDGVSYTNQQIADIYKISLSGVSFQIRRIEAIIYEELLKEGLYIHQPNSKRIKQNIISKYQELIPKGRKLKTIFEYFPGYTERQILDIINILPYEEQKYIYLKNGIFLDKPTPCKGWKQEYNNMYYSHIIPKISKQLKKQYGIPKECETIKTRAKVKKDN